MEVIQTAIEGVVIIEPRLFNDARGYFSNLSHNGISTGWSAPYISCKTMKARAVTAYCAVFIFKTAIRTKQVSTRHQRRRIGRGRGYPERVAYFRSTCSCRSDRRKPSSILHPRGFAHGFSVLTPEVIFQYKCDNFYAPQSEGALAWDDPDLGINWRIPSDKILLSERTSVILA